MASSTTVSYTHLDVYKRQGVAIRKDVIDLTEDEWDLALDVTLKGICLLYTSRCV